MQPKTCNISRPGIPHLALDRYPRQVVAGGPELRPPPTAVRTRRYVAAVLFLFPVRAPFVRVPAPANLRLRLSWTEVVILAGGVSWKTRMA